MYRGGTFIGGFFLLLPNMDVWFTLRSTTWYNTIKDPHLLRLQLQFRVFTYMYILLIYYTVKNWHTFISYITSKYMDITRLALIIETCENITYWWKLAELKIITLKKSNFLGGWKKKKKRQILKYNSHKVELTWETKHNTLKHFLTSKCYKIKYILH